MKLVRQTGTLELWEAGPYGHAGVAVTGSTPRTGDMRIVLDLTPAQCLDVARELTLTARRALSQSNAEGT